MTTYDINPVYNKQFKGNKINGKANGSGQLYDEKGNIIYEGNFINNFINGNGIEFYYNGNKHKTGNWINGTLSKGILYDINGFIIFEGKYDNNGSPKNGILYKDNNIKYYKGDICEGISNGIIYHDNNTQIKYKGQVYFSKEIIIIHGVSKIIQQPIQCGNGQSYDESGKLIYDGLWFNGKKSGNGKEYYENGNLAYEGDWKDCNRHGQGKEYCENGDILYEGTFYNNKRHGNSFYFDKKNNKIKSNWKYGKKIDKEITYDNIPEEFICPITKEIMDEPVMNEFGFNYEKYEIEKWMLNNNTDPMTNNQLNNRLLFPNFSLKNNINEWKNSYQV